MNNETTLFIALGFFITCVTFTAVLFFYVNKFYEFLKTDKVMTRHITDFDAYVAVLQYHMDKSYMMIYKDRIMIYSIDGFKITDEQFEEIAKEFVILTLKLLGENLASELANLYTEDALYMNITEYFDTKLENDQIRKASVDQLVDTPVVAD